MLRRYGDTQARLHVQPDPRHRDGVAQPGEHPVRQGGGHLGMAHDAALDADEQGELVPAQAGDQDLRPGSRRQPLGHLDEQQVADVVTQRVVDLLEVVQVGQDNHDAVTRGLGLAQQPVELPLEQGSVGKRRQPVVERVVLTLGRQLSVDAHRSHRQDQDRHERHGEGVRDDHQGRQHDEHPPGEQLEAQVGRQAAEHRLVRRQGDGGAHAGMVDQDEHQPGGESGSEVFCAERARPQEALPGQQAEGPPGRHEGDRVLGGVEQRPTPVLAAPAVVENHRKCLGEHDQPDRGDEQERDGEGRGDRDLVARPSATGDRDRQQLADDEHDHQQDDIGDADVQRGAQELHHGPGG